MHLQDKSPYIAVAKVYYLNLSRCPSTQRSMKAQRKLKNAAIGSRDVYTRLEPFDRSRGWLLWPCRRTRTSGHRPRCTGMRARAGIGVLSHELYRDLGFTGFVI